MHHLPFARQFHDFLTRYFRDGFKYQINSQGFKGDDMLQEGFAEVVTSKTIKLRVVEKTQNGYTNEAIIENGIVYLQVSAPEIANSKLD